VLLSNRAIRLPVLLAQRVVFPLDMTGLANRPENVIRHLLGAHHDANQFVYDLEMLSIHQGQLEALHREVTALIDEGGRRLAWYRDLVVYEGYHEALKCAVERALRGDFAVAPDEVDDPDITFSAFMRWCAAQPSSLSETVRAVRRGRFAFPGGLTP
jgi:hypothetical protein